MTPNEELPYSTVRIECQNDLNSSTGTGFLFNFNHQNKFCTVVITNKHVVHGFQTATFFLTHADESGNPIDTSHYGINLPELQNFVVNHPEEDVDLCAIPINPILLADHNKQQRFCYRSFGEQHLLTNESYPELDAIEDVLMIGYPNGLWDNVNNKPIIRKGLTATNPKFDYCGKQEFLIDAACFPGSSGSPVVIASKNETLNTLNGELGFRRLILLGVLYAGPVIEHEGEVRFAKPKELIKPTAYTTLTMNLGTVIKAEKIMAFKEIFLKHFQ